MSWYNIMSRGWIEESSREPDGAAADVLFRPLVIVLVVAVGVILLHAGAVMLGLTSWLGYRRVEVENSPRVALSGGQTWNGNNNQADARDLGLGLPMFALSGQSLLVSYDIAANNHSPAPIKAIIHVNCLCGHENWHDIAITGPGTGILEIPVTDQDFYHIWISQSSAADGSTSEASYWFGVRGAK